MAARRMGYRTIVLDPDPDAPAGAIADVHLVAPYDDANALDHLASRCDVVTVEFENPSAVSLERLAEHTAEHPDSGRRHHRPAGVRIGHVDGAASGGRSLPAATSWRR
jgi:phosphoribosylaminoimidazole carboxylase (NCAIR synthetase)